MKFASKFDRRILLRGLFQGSSVAMALPFLDCMLDNSGQAFAATGTKIPVRFGTYFWGCGLNKQLFLPQTAGKDWEITPQLASLKPLQKKLNLVSGMRVPLDDNPNFQHWSGNAAIMTGIAPTQANAFDAPTLDQTIADAIGRGTRFKSIEVACSGIKSESFSSLGGKNINPPETSPMALYKKLFGTGFQDPQRPDWKPDPQVMVQQSVLSTVAEDRKRLMSQVGANDKQRLEQYFDSVRQAEQQIEAELQRPEIAAKVEIPTEPGQMPVSKAVPTLQRVVPLMAKLIAIGIATDQTRVFNVALSESASTIFMPGDSKPFHQTTHEEAIDPVLQYQLTASKFSTYSVEMFASLLKELDSVPEGDGTLLDHMLVLGYTDVSFAKIHALDGIPMVLVGGANGRMKGGYHIDGHGDPVSRVGLTIQHALNMPASNWGKFSLNTNKPITEILV
jgi:hypothetical protein